MKFLDRVLQYWRIRQATPYIAPGARVLDIGCADGALFRQLGDRIGEGVGIDPDLEQSQQIGQCRLVAGQFPDNLPAMERFDAITMLAVVEHIATEHLPELARNCARFLNPDGYLVITVPSPRVDQILGLLKFLRIIDGMSLEEHHQFDVTIVPSLFSVDGVKLVKAKRFELGLNRLFVFRKVSDGLVKDLSGRCKKDHESQSRNCS
jgi:2-polyprenyl-3-methyl-5-hydroxy-6-metoxy-1,4-benzoquinol methylase